MPRRGINYHQNFVASKRQRAHRALTTYDVRTCKTTRRPLIGRCLASDRGGPGRRMRVAPFTLSCSTSLHGTLALRARLHECRARGTVKTKRAQRRLRYTLSLHQRPAIAIPPLVCLASAAVSLATARVGQSLVACPLPHAASLRRDPTRLPITAAAAARASPAEPLASR